MPLDFTKMHGTGNDYVYVEGFTKELPGDLPALAVRVSDRHTGVGGDGLICVLPPTAKDADVRMRMFNNDGGEAEMCGNGLRCVAKLAHDRGLVSPDANPLRVETGRGVLAVDLLLDAGGKVEAATVDMGEPILDLERIGVQQAPGGPRKAGLVDAGDHVYHVNFRVRPSPLAMTFVSMGNPHAVLFFDDLNQIDPAADGPRIETHPIFPRKINVHWVQVLSRSEVNVVHWERGTGVTQACGTGACAVCVAGVVTGRTDRQIVAHLPGGDLKLRWDEPSDHVFMTGPAVEVFRGSIAL